MNLQGEQERIYGEIDRIGREANPNVGCFNDGVAFPDTFRNTVEEQAKSSSLAGAKPVLGKLPIGEALDAVRESRERM